MTNICSHIGIKWQIAENEPTKKKKHICIYEKKKNSDTKKISDIYIII